MKNHDLYNRKDVVFSSRDLKLAYMDFDTGNASQSYKLGKFKRSFVPSLAFDTEAKVLLNEKIPRTVKRGQDLDEPIVRDFGHILEKTDAKNHRPAVQPWPTFRDFELVGPDELHLTS